MAYIVYRKNKASGTVYAYRQESYRDPVTKKPRNRRTYLGRVDPETNTIIEKAPRAKTGTDELPNEENINPEIERLKETIQKKDEQIAMLTQRLKEADRQMQSVRQLLDKLMLIANAEKQ